MTAWLAARHTLVVAAGWTVLVTVMLAAPLSTWWRNRAGQAGPDPVDERATVPAEAAPDPEAVEIAALEDLLKLPTYTRPTDPEEIR